MNAPYWAVTALLLGIGASRARSEGPSAWPGDGKAQPSSFPGAGEGHARPWPEFAGEPEAEPELTDLTLGNLFREGWRQEFRARSRRGRAPRFHLFTTFQPTIDREVRLDFSFLDDKNQTEDEVELAGEMEIPFNRRFMLGFEPFYVWTDRREEEPDGSAPGIAAFAIVQLVDTRDSALNLRMGFKRAGESFGTTLAESEGETEGGQETILTAILAGFEDLTDSLGLYRTGFTYHAQYFALVGPSNPERANHGVSYAAALARTLTEPDVPHLGDFTLFVEMLGITTLDGANAGRTGIAFTPGFRVNLGTEEQAWWLMAGMEFSVSGPRPFDQVVRVALIHWFD